MSITPITQRSYEYLHDQVRTHMVDKVLPKVFPDLVSKLKPLHTYPVVLGGTLVQRCAKRSARAHWFVKDLLTEDVDIKLVVNEPTKTPEDAIYGKLDKIRHEAFREVTRLLTPFLKKLETTGLEITTGINESLLTAKNVLSMEVTYKEISNITARSVTLPLLDMNFFSDVNTPHFGKFRKQFPNVKLPIPYVKHRGVLYATCNYAYFDTVRMMVERLRFFQEKKTMFGLMKFARYVLKFMCLHTLLISNEVAVDPKLKEIYDEVVGVLKTIDVAKLSFADAMKTQYNEQYITNVARILTMMVHTTHIEDLIAFMDSSVPTPNKIKLEGGVRGRKCVRPRSKNGKDPLKCTVQRLQSIVA